MLSGRASPTASQHDSSEDVDSDRYPEEIHPSKDESRHQSVEHCPKESSVRFFPQSKGEAKKMCCHGDKYKAWLQKKLSLQEQTVNCITLQDLRYINDNCVPGKLDIPLYWNKIAQRSKDKPPAKRIPVLSISSSKSTCLDDIPEEPGEEEDERTIKIVVN